MKIIALTGIRGSGKTTVASVLAQALRKQGVYFPFKTPVIHDYEEQEGHPYRKTPTAVSELNKLTYKGNKIDPNFWVDRWNELAGQYEDDAILIVDDLRFPAHYRYLRNCKEATIIELRRDEPTTRIHEDKHISDFSPDLVISQGTPEERAWEIMDYLNIESEVGCLSCFDSSTCLNRCFHV